MAHGHLPWKQLSRKLYDYILATRERHKLNIRQDNGLYKYSIIELKKVLGLDSQPVGYLMRILEAEGRIVIVEKRITRRGGHRTSYIIRFPADG